MGQPGKEKWAGVKVLNPHERRSNCQLDHQHQHKPHPTIRKPWGSSSGLLVLPRESSDPDIAVQSPGSEPSSQPYHLEQVASQTSG
jgi:hypothetical protein